MATNVPNDPRDERRLQAALDVLRRWRKDAIRSHAQTTNEEMRRVYRQRADDAEYLVFRLEQLLRPAGPPEFRESGENGG